MGSQSRTRLSDTRFTLTSDCCPYKKREMWAQALWGEAQSEVRMEAETRVTRTPARKCPEEQEASSPRPREKPRLCPCSDCGLPASGLGENKLLIFSAAQNVLTCCGSARKGIKEGPSSPLPPILRGPPDLPSQQVTRWSHSRSPALGRFPQPPCIPGTVTRAPPRAGRAGHLAVFLEQMTGWKTACCPRTNPILLQRLLSVSRFELASPLCGGSRDRRWSWGPAVGG